MEGMDERPPAAAADMPAQATAPAPRLSRPALWILLLLPAAFIPIFRLTFPHVGLWPAAAIVVLGAVLLHRRAGGADRLAALYGLAAAAVAFAGAGIVSLAEMIPGDVPKFALSAEPGEISWAVRIVSLTVLFFSITLHEYAHALTAYLSGDATARDGGRLTLNPLAHVDLFGSIILPVILTVLPGGFVFGWAKPVPVDPANFRNPRRGRLAVSVSGVGANLTLALLSASLLGAVGILLHAYYPEMSSISFMNPWRQVELAGLPHAAFWGLVVEGLKNGVFLNMILFSLNVLPIPPLDGFGLLEGLAPERIRALLGRMRGWGSLVFVALLFSGALGYLIIPGGVVAMFLNYFAGAMAKLG